MSKELTPLEALENIKKIPILSTPESTQKIFYDKHKKELDIIENALKRQDSIEITAIDIEQDNKELCKENKKLKRVLNIIKEKRVDLEFLFEEWEEENWEFALENYNMNHEIELTKKEYELLKEVLL